MKLYSYVVARDYGFAPNPFYGFCTLATCKPIIRRGAQVGDWIIGTGSKANHKENNLVFVMRVTETLTFEQYWNDIRFENKKPDLKASKKKAFGDNIYSRANPLSSWTQLNSHHSLNDGSPNPENIRNDTQTNRVLISNHYTYWGGNGPEILPPFLNIRGRRGHKNAFSAAFINDFTDWLASLSQFGYCGIPFDWPKSQ